MVCSAYPEPVVASTSVPYYSSQSCWLAIEDLRSREWRAGWVWCEHSRCRVLGASTLLHGAVLQKWLLYDWPCVASLESSAAVKISCRIAVLLGARSTLFAAPVGGCSNGSACHGHSMHCWDEVYRHWYLANHSVGATRAVLLKSPVPGSTQVLFFSAPGKVNANHLLLNSLLESQWS